MTTLHKQVLCLMLCSLGLVMGSFYAEGGKARCQKALPSLTPVTLAPLSQLTAQLGGETFQLEVAATSEEQVRGLMYREHLGAHQGMIFTFPSLRLVSFWMKNCKIPLDMIFIREYQIMNIVHAAPPCLTDPCTTYPSVYSIDSVIELPAGTADHLTLKPGDSVYLLPSATEAPPSNPKSN